MQTLLVDAAVAWAMQSLLSPSLTLEPYGQVEKGEVLIVVV
jgi:hypothetical protein